MDFLKGKDTKVKTLVVYTMMFALFSFVAFFWLMIEGKTNMWFFDGYEQHYKALIFYGDLLRSSLKAVFGGRVDEISSFSFLIGEGNDALAILHYYAIGDPLCLITVFFNSSNMYICYILIGTLRLYFAGLAFLYMCNYFKAGTLVARITGCMTYVFSVWGVYYFTRHPLFLIPLIYLPLMVVGVEKLFKKEKSLLLTTSVFLSAISNFYYFYNLVLLIVVYSVVRCIVLYRKDIKEYVFAFCRVLLNSLLGVLMSCVIFLPVAYTFLIDSRSDIDFDYVLFGNLDFYKEIPVNLLATPTTLNEVSYSLGITALSVIALVVLFTNKKTESDRNAVVSLRVLSIIALVFFLMPVFGQIFNGMSYRINKWAFAIPLLLGFIIVYCFESIVESFKKKNLYVAIVVISLFALMLVFESSRRMEYFIDILVIALLLSIVYFVFPKISRKFRDVLLVGFAALTIAINSFWIYSVFGVYFVDRLFSVSDIINVDNCEEVLTIKSLDDESFYRYSGYEIHENASILTGVPTAMHYWTNTNSNVVDFNTKLQLRHYILHYYTDFDDRTALNEISSLKYYLVPKDYSIVPYGYSKMSVPGCQDYAIYKNDHPLGLTYSSDKIFSYEYFDSLDVLERQELLLAGVVADKNDNEFEYCDECSFNSLDIDFTYECDDSTEIDLEKGIIKFSEDLSLIHIDFEGVPMSETYLTVEGLRREDGDDTGIIYIVTDDGVIKSITVHEKNFHYYNGRRDFVVNLGYRDEPLNSVSIALAYPGEIKFDSLKISCVPMTDYIENVNYLSRDVLENVEIKSGKVSGNINISDPRMLVFSIPYSEGWSAYVDGNEVEIYKADVKYMGLYLNEGNHDIVLKYSTPYLKIGALLTLAGFICFISVACYYRKVRK